MMEAREALIAWTPAHLANDPTAGQIKIGLLLSEGDRDWTAPYASTGGAAYKERRTLPDDTSALMAFVDFHTVVVRDGIDPQVAHQAFLAIDEYRERISPDITGAEVEGL